MSTQEIGQDVGMQAWVQFLRTHAALKRALNADLLNAHGLTINDYDVLLHLAHAPERRLRRVDLAERVVLTASGITRLLDGLQAAALVRRVACDRDGRVAYAELTPKGLAKLRAAAGTHLDGIRRLFTDRFTDAELATLAELLARVPTAAPGADACDVD